MNTLIKCIIKFKFNLLNLQSRAFIFFFFLNIFIEV